MRSLFSRKTVLLQTPKPPGCVLLLVDWENLFFTLLSRFGLEDVHIEERVKKLMEWIQAEIGELLGGHGFVFAPEHQLSSHQGMCAKNNLWLMTCPKRSKGVGQGEEDTVDETLISFGKIMLRHPDVKFICLVSGDEDFLPLLEEAKKYKVKVALVAPTIGSLSSQGGLLRFVDKGPITLARMFLRLDIV